jgi:Putative peptidoglycan binding domain
MARIMGDTIHKNAAVLQRAKIQLVAGYDTGTPDVKWITQDWELFPDLPHVHIDQGYGDSRSTEAHVLVFDIETGAFQPNQAESLINANTTARPTIYSDRFNLLPTVVSAMRSPKFKGDVWLAYPGWSRGMPLPVLPSGCRYVAIQDTYMSTFDLSTVIDNTWPNPLVPANWTETAMSELPAIGLGASGPFVRRAQALCVANLLPIRIDGIFGSETQTAIKTTQTDAHITVDGIVGQETWPALLGV